MAEYKKNLEELNDIGTKTIETNRLLLRKFQISDACLRIGGLMKKPDNTVI